MITEVSEQSQVGEARRRAVDAAHRLGMDEEQAGRVAIVVTELATNLIKHGGSGHVLADTFKDEDGSGLEVLALDKGKGIADVDRGLRDGYSTAGSPGTGLGAIRRQSDAMHVYSRPGLGTAIMARFVLSPPAPHCATQIGAAVAPYPGETICGDRWSFGLAADGRSLLVVDGSGHGAEASRAASLAVEVFQQHLDDPGERLMERIHRALAPTRGAAVALARIDETNSSVHYVGVGNISGVLVTDGVAKHMVSHNGTAGHVAPRIRSFSYPYAGRPTLILHSDGVGTRWNLAAYPGLAVQHPSLIAGVLLRDHRRGRDDASVVAVRAMV